MEAPLRGTGLPQVARATERRRWGTPPRLAGPLAGLLAGLLAAGGLEALRLAGLPPGGSDPLLLLTVAGCTAAGGRAPGASCGAPLLLYRGSGWLGGTAAPDGPTALLLVVSSTVLVLIVGALRERADLAMPRLDRERGERRALEGQLLQAQKMGSLGQLTGGIAHEFNNLLTTVRGHSELLLADLADDARARDSVLQIQAAADGATALSRQLLSFGRPDSLGSGATPLADVVRSTGQMLRPLIGDAIRLEVHASPATGRVRAMPIQLQQVILNLAINARDAMPDGGRLELRTSDVEIDAATAASTPGMRPGRYVLLAARDTGCGMDEEVRAHLFEPFFTTKAPDKGTGLGLSTVYGLVKGWGGYIAVGSAPGRGSTFLVYLPRIEEAAAAAEGPGGA